ncbi:MAG: hypothetical protein U0572_11510 [Phycisphaerales bacterium]
MRIAILGNSGSGKSTLARWLASKTNAALLDLDTVAWEPGQIAVPRDPLVARADVRTWCAARDAWIVEGCYGSLVSVALEYSPRLVFMNPGVSQCLENCRSRPWEPQKYASRREQDERLPMLLAWVCAYDTRDDDMSLRAHRRLFDEYRGPKSELTVQLRLDASDSSVLAWLQ